MTQEDKELLLKDLCARLPYGVKCIEKTPIEDFQDKNLWEIDRIRSDTNMFGMSNCYVCYGQYEDIHNIKPYLFPLSSMTEEQMEELKELCNMYTPDDDYHPYAYKGIKVLYKHILDDNYKFNFKIDVIDWFNKNHFDYRGLIEKGLAIDATGLNIY
jgi:hypothetical protein